MNDLKRRKLFLERIKTSLNFPYLLKAVQLWENAKHAF